MVPTPVSLGGGGGGAPPLLSSLASPSAGLSPPSAVANLRQQYRQYYSF